jgi:hypothetical protein
LLALGFIAGAALPTSAQPTDENPVYQICTRKPGSRVNLRTGPSTSFAVGLEQVGSGGRAVDNTFRELGYSLAQGDVLGDQIDQYQVVQNSQGESWSLVGTNQWVAWVRSDFICPIRLQN